jgi:hypothetical protein
VRDTGGAPERNRGIISGSGGPKEKFRNQSVWFRPDRVRRSLMRAAARIVVLCTSIDLLLLNPPLSGQQGSKVDRGLQISPVPVKLANLDRSLVGWGSYLVNAASGCANCHTCPTFVPGSGKAKQINAQNYMAGGVPFAIPAPGEGRGRPILRSADLTPDEHGRPGGLTFVQFKAALTEGHRTLTEAFAEFPPPSEAYAGEISVMPWRIYQNYDTDDLAAIYEYLRAIPPAKPGTCTGPGQ